uniref:BED-type domain-containing protein n=1 Tax=Strongyloides venezuelensis TaxID=75913 RepID=A0A0K0F0F3_STRVS
MDIEKNLHVNNDTIDNNDVLVFRKMNESNQSNFAKNTNLSSNKMVGESPILNIKPHGNKRRQPHPVNIYFEFFRENFEAVCNMCKKKVKCPKTFNLKRHLARYHAEEFKRVEALWNQINLEKISANGHNRKNSPSPRQINGKQVIIPLQNQIPQQHIAGNFHKPTQNIQSLKNASPTLISPLLSHISGISTGSNNFSQPPYDFSPQSSRMANNFLSNISDIAMNPQLPHFLSMLQNTQPSSTMSPTISNERITENIVQPKQQQNTALLRKDKNMDGLLIKKLPKINKEEDQNEKARRLLTCYALTARFSLVDMDNSFLRELLGMIPNFEVPTSKGLTDLMIDAVIKYGD